MSTTPPDSARPQHLERTAGDPRAASMVSTTLSAVGEATPSTRLLTLSLAEPLAFQPGQWLDVWLPGIETAGGFTIVSAPSLASAEHGQLAQPQRRRPGSPQLQLAVKRSNNVPAAWLWRGPEEILGAEIRVRVGGAFTWPPRAPVGAEVGKSVERLLFVAGGVGINPFVSMLKALDEAFEHGGSGPVPREVTMLYGCKVETTSSDEAEEGVQAVLFKDTLTEIFSRRHGDAWKLEFYLTGDKAHSFDEDKALHGIGFTRRRMTTAEAIDILGPPEQRHTTLAYVCGPQAMTDSFVTSLSTAEGMSENRVLCEKWW